MTLSIGGGICCEASQLSVIECIVQLNQADQGGGIFIDGGWADIQDSSFEGNTAYYTGKGGGAYNNGELILTRTSFLFNGSGGGGAVFGNPIAQDCRFEGNVAFDSGGGAVLGGGMFSGCTFVSNICREYDGGAVLGDGTFIDSVFLSNSALDSHNGGGVAGGGTFLNCSFVGNGAYKGGAVYGGAYFEGCQFVANQVSDPQYSNIQGGALWTAGLVVDSVFLDNMTSGSSLASGNAVYGSAILDGCTILGIDPNTLYTSGVQGATMVNTIVRGAGQPELSGGATATYSNILGGHPGTGNIDEDPLFWDPNGGDFHLMPGSPCIDAGDPMSPLDPDGSIADMGAFPFDPDYCPPATNYCTAGTTGNGCMATISATGTPSATAASGFNVSVTNVEGQKQGIIFWGLTGKAAPWGGGSSWLCVQAPAKRTGTQDSGGTAGQCVGSFSLDFNAWMATNPGKAPGLGEVIYMQAWFRDPPSPKTTSLSDGLRFVVCQ